MKPELLKEIAQIKRQISLLEDFVMPKDVSYSNIEFTDNSKYDKVNRALLDDINKSAKQANVKVRVGTITKNHPSLKSGEDSRHPSGMAVDVDMVNGKAVSQKIKDVVDNFVRELEKLGYNKNAEIGFDKSVLTFGFEDHDDHIHVSNRTDEASSEEEDSEENSEEDSEETKKAKKKDPNEPRFNLDKILQTVKDFKSGIGF
jgi:hypothetical protein